MLCTFQVFFSNQFLLCFCFFQRLRLREFLIRQKLQRNTIRQEKEAAAAAAAGSGSPGWPGGEMGAFQQDKAHRAPPPYPQVCTLRICFRLQIPFECHSFQLHHFIAEDVL